MTVQTLKLGGRKFVVVAEKDFRALKAKAAKRRISPGKPRRLSVQERGDIAEAQRREHEPSALLQDVRKRLGL